MKRKGTYDHRNQISRICVIASKSKQAHAYFDAYQLEVCSWMAILALC